MPVTKRGNSRPKPSGVRRRAAVAEVSSDGISALTQSFLPGQYDQIAELAYSYWEARGCQGGSPEEDWARAEAELKALQG